jgi:D-glycero-alpha-D-manno-heptose 1-phosphate guanylyltransferase
LIKIYLNGTLPLTIIIPIFNIEESVVEAIILVGGLGTRLKQLTENVPKPMLPIGPRPFLSYLLDYLAGEGVKNVILSVSYKYDVIVSYFGDRYKSIDLRYSIENEPLGTGGAIKYALEQAQSNNILVLNGDTLFCVSLTKMLSFHENHNSCLTIALKPMAGFSRYGNVVLDGDYVVAFEEKAEKNSGYISGGLYLFKKDIFDKYNLPRKFSVEEDFFERYIERIRPFGFVSDNYFIDIGIPDDYLHAQEELTRIIRYRDNHGFKK